MLAIPDQRAFRLNLREWPREDWNGPPTFPLEVVEDD
jgi:hypothetical protein